tara:strand:- start:464 stop:574 length:111 start_codon:yes stop_codon:yes gene_type:complete
LVAVVEEVQDLVKILLLVDPLVVLDLDMEMVMVLIQ